MGAACVEAYRNTGCLCQLLRQRRRGRHTLALPLSEALYVKVRRSLLQCIMYVCLYVGRSGRHAAGPPAPTHANTRSLYPITPTVVVVLRILRGHLHFYDPLHLQFLVCRGGGREGWWGEGRGKPTKLNRLAIRIHSFVIFTNRFDFGNVCVSLLFLLFCGGWIHASLYG